MGSKKGSSRAIFAKKHMARAKQIESAALSLAKRARVLKANLGGK